MATSTNLLGTEIHEVQESWGGWKDLQAANWAAKCSSKDIYYFRVCTYQVTENNGPERHPLTWGPLMVGWPNFLSLVWEGRSKWVDLGKPFVDYTYHLGIICAWCLDYFTTSADAMHWHIQLCKPSAASNSDEDREEEDYKDDDNGDEDDEFMFSEDLPAPSTLFCGAVTTHHSTLVFMPGKAFLAKPLAVHTSCILVVPAL